MLPFIVADENCLPESEFAGLPLDVAASARGLCADMIRRECEQPEMTVVNAMSGKGTGAAIA